MASQVTQAFAAFDADKRGLRSKTRNLETNDIRKTTQQQTVGSRYTGGRSSYRSLMDGNALDRQIQERFEKWGGSDHTTPGVYNLKLVGDDGNQVAGGTINIGGRMFRSNENGDIRILDSGYINEEVQFHNAVQEYELKILNACLVSNIMAQNILGRANFAKLAGGQGLTGMDADLLAVSALPESIQFLDPTSKTYAQAIAKLKMIIHDSGVIVNEQENKLTGAGKIKQVGGSNTD